MKWLRRVLFIVLAVLVGGYLLLRTPDTDPAAMKAKYGGAPSQFLAMGNGLNVHVRDEGPRDAPVIVLLHGSNADLHTWDPWAAQLSKTYRIIRFDQPGHGLTGPAPDGVYSPARIVDVIEQVTTQLGVTRFALAGNSMGGGNALSYALAHPEKLTALVLIDSAGAPLSDTDEVTITVEMVHDVRHIRLNTRQHPPSNVRPWFGDSVGWYEGDPLVVETTNIPQRQAYMGSWQNLKVTERFRRVAKDRLLYQFSIEDQTIWDKPWGGEYEFADLNGELHEYACHEGNYALEGILAGARAEEADAAGRRAAAR